MSVKNPNLYKDYFKSNMTDEQCARIEQIKSQQDFPIFEHMIFKFPTELIMESFERQVSIRSIVKERDIDITPYRGTLRPYQRVGMAFGVENKHCMLGDAVGLGKTAEVSGIINYLYMNKQITRFVIAVETTAVGQTQIELMKFTGLNIVALPSDTAKIKKAIDKIDWDNVDGIVIKHSTLRSNIFNSWIAQFIGSGGKNSFFNTFILDESSVIKSDTSQVHNYTKNICNMVDRTIFMNATPFEKCLMDIYYQFDMMDSELLPDKAFMNKNFCTWKSEAYWTTVRTNGVPKKQRNTHWTQSGYKNEEIFKNSLSLAYLGRSLKDVGMDVEHTYKVYVVPTSEKQRQAIQSGMAYNEVLNCPSLLPTSGVQFNRTDCPKLDRLCELATSELSGLHFVVYCWHVQAQYKIKEELEKLGLECCVLNGNDPSGADKDMKKLQLIQDFNEGRYDVFITNAQRSINLYGADAMILYSNSATVGKMEQIRGRIDRHVDDNKRLFIMLLYEGTGEFDLINEKARMRGEASRKLILDAQTAIDYFIASIDEQKENGT